MLSLLLTACGATVALDYDTTTDFSIYKTYNFYPSIESGLSELDENRITQITDSLLQQKGFEKTETPQLLINFFASEYISDSGSSIGIGIGGGGRNVGVGVGGDIPIGSKIVNQHFTMDFVDAAKDDLVWQAVVDDDYKVNSTPAMKETYYTALLQKILAKYPPK